MHYDERNHVLFEPGLESRQVWVSQRLGTAGHMSGIMSHVVLGSKAAIEADQVVS